MKAFATAVMRFFIVGLVLALAGPASAQQPYPSRTVSIIVPTAPGSGTDVIARILAAKLSTRMGQQLIVVNKVGANNAIAIDALRTARPDGYTLLMITNSLVLVPLLEKVNYDPIKDLAPVGTMASSEFVLVVNPSLPVKNVQELVSLAKSKPGQLNFGSSGVGSVSHVGAEVFNDIAGIKVQHIPFKGSSESATALAGGEVQMVFGTPSTYLSLIHAGKARALAVTGKDRFADLPDVPTFAEVGMPGVEVETWTGMLAPAGTPKEISGKLSSEISALLDDPEIGKILADQALVRSFTTPEQFGTLIKSDTERYSKVLKTRDVHSAP